MRGLTDYCVKRRDKKPGGLNGVEMTSVLGMNGHLKSRMLRELPGCPVVRAPCFHCTGHRFDPWSGN